MSSLIFCDGFIASKSVNKYDSFSRFQISMANGKDKSGEKNKPTYLTIIAQGQPNGLIAEGERVLLCGYISTNYYKDKEGNDRSQIQVVTKMENIIAHNFEEAKQFYETVQQLYKGLLPNLDDFEL